MCCIDRLRSQTNLLGAIAIFLSPNALAQEALATIEWEFIALPVPVFGGSALALLGLVLVVLGVRKLWRRNANVSAIRILPLLAGALLTYQFIPQLIDSARALGGILLETSPTALSDGMNEVQNPHVQSILITAFQDGTCPIGQSDASDPVCQTGMVLAQDQICNVYVKCPLIAFVASPGDVPGNLGGLAGADNTCQSQADSAGLHGTFVAWLSDSSNDARDRFDSNFADFPYIRTGDGALVANDFDDFTDQDGDGAYVLNGINHRANGHLYCLQKDKSE